MESPGKIIIELGLSHHENACAPASEREDKHSGESLRQPVRGKKERARGKPVSDRKVERQGGD